MDHDLCHCVIVSLCHCVIVSCNIIGTNISKSNPIIKMLLNVLFNVLVYFLFIKNNILHPDERTMLITYSNNRITLNVLIEQFFSVTVYCTVATYNAGIVSISFLIYTVMWTPPFSSMDHINHPHMIVGLRLALQYSVLLKKNLAPLSFVN